MKITSSSLRIYFLLRSVEESKSVLHMFAYDDARILLKNIREKLFLY
jgi:hypothetical protein